MAADKAAPEQVAQGVFDGRGLGPDFLAQARAVKTVMLLKKQENFDAERRRNIIGGEGQRGGFFDVQNRAYFIRI